MMGQLPAQQNALFYEFCLENHIPEEHLLRQIDLFLDFDQTREHLDLFYSHTGRPSIDPELMIRLLLIGYCYGVPRHHHVDQIIFWTHFAIGWSIYQENLEPKKILREIRFLNSIFGLVSLICVTKWE